MQTEDPKEKIINLFKGLSVENKDVTQRPAFQPIIIGNNNIVVHGDFVQQLGASGHSRSE